MKDPDEVRPPTGDFFLVILCVEMPNNDVSFALLEDISLDVGNGPEVMSKGSLGWGTQCVHCWCDSRRQLLDCFAHRIVEIAQPLPVQSSVESGTDLSASQPEFDVIYLIHHRFLDGFQSEINQRITKGSPL